MIREGQGKRRGFAENTAKFGRKKPLFTVITPLLHIPPSTHRVPSTLREHGPAQGRPADIDDTHLARERVRKVGAQ